MYLFNESEAYKHFIYKRGLSDFGVANVLHQLVMEIAQNSHVNCLLSTRSEQAGLGHQNWFALLVCQWHWGEYHRRVLQGRNKTHCLHKSRAVTSTCKYSKSSCQTAESMTKALNMLSHLGVDPTPPTQDDKIGARRSKLRNILLICQRQTANLSHNHVWFLLHSCPSQHGNTVLQFYFFSCSPWHHCRILTWIFSISIE